VNISPDMLIYGGIGGEQEWQRHWSMSVSGIRVLHLQRKKEMHLKPIRQYKTIPRTLLKRVNQSLNVDLSDTLESSTDEERHHEREEEENMHQIYQQLYSKEGSLAGSRATSVQPSGPPSSEEEEEELTSDSSDASYEDESITREYQTGEKRKTFFNRYRVSHQHKCWIGAEQQPSQQRIYVYQWRVRDLGHERKRPGLPVRLVRVEWLREVDSLGIPIRPPALITLDDVQNLYWYTDSSCTSPSSISSSEESDEDEDDGFWD
jgi:hypothetical protein